MSRDAHPQYTPNVALSSFGTPSHSFQPLWTTPNANFSAPIVMGTGFQTYPAYLATPGPQNLQCQLGTVINRKVMKIWARVHQRSWGKAKVKEGSLPRATRTVASM